MYRLRYVSPTAGTVQIGDTHLRYMSPTTEGPGSNPRPFLRWRQSNHTHRLANQCAPNYDDAGGETFETRPCELRPLAGLPGARRTHATIAQAWRRLELFKDVERNDAKRATDGPDCGHRGGERSAGHGPILR